MGPASLQTYSSSLGWCSQYLPTRQISSQLITFWHNISPTYSSAIQLWTKTLATPQQNHPWGPPQRKKLSHPTTWTLTSLKPSLIKIILPTQTKPSSSPLPSTPFSHSLPPVNKIGSTPIKAVVTPPASPTHRMSIPLWQFTPSSVNTSLLHGRGLGLGVMSVGVIRQLW